MLCIALGLGASACTAGDAGNVGDAGDGDAGDRDGGPPGACAPAIDGPVYAVEGTELILPVTCADGRAIAEVGVQPLALPSGASFDRVHALLRWTPALDQAAVYAIGSSEIAIADRFDDPSNVEVVDPSRYPSEFGLPVFHLWTSPDINDEEHTPARLVYRGREFYYVEAKYRGRSSLSYPKKSFTLKFFEDDPFVDTERGFGATRRLVLTSNFDDNSYLRQPLAFELWNRLEPTVPVRTFSAVVFLDGAYHGLYTVINHVDDELVETAGLWKGSNLYKARSHDANLRLEDRSGKKKSKLEAGYTKEEGEPEADEPGAFDDLHEFVTWVATAPDASFVDELATRVDRRAFENWLLLVSVIDARDSAGKNGYLIHDPRPDAADTRWHYVPWDFNASFGQTWQTGRLPSDQALDRYTTANAMFERMVTLPALAAATAARYTEALHGAWLLDDVLAVFDARVTEIDASARRDEQKWQADFRAYDWGERTEFETYEQEVAYVRSWIEGRWSVVNAQFP